MIFCELYKHGKLATKRHPIYESSKIGRAFAYVGSALGAGYLMFFGIFFARTLPDLAPHLEPYHVLNSVVLVFILMLDFLMRFSLQKTPTQEMKPYLLLPIKRNRLIDFLLIRSGLSLFNLFWMFFFAPFALLTVCRFYGVAGVLAYLLGIWLLMLANNYWYLLCRTLMGERIWWVLLPVAFYAGIGCWLFLPDESPLFDFFLALGDGYIEGRPLYFLGTLLLVLLLWSINRRLMARLVYAELAKTEDVRLKKVSEYRFLERYGEVGEYMKLEIKMQLRNRRCKTALRSVFLMVILFSLALSFSEVYDGEIMKSFICVYNFAVFGMIILTQLMSYEGNYIDGLMSRKESIASLLKAKYYIYSLAEVIPFLLMLPAVFMGKLSLLGAVSWCFYTIGFVYFCYFQLAVYNKQALPLNEKLTARQTGTGLQMLVSFATFSLPILFFSLLRACLSETQAYLVLLIVGLGLVLTSPLWLRNVYNRFMLRRYENMEGFRDSRQ